MGIYKYMAYLILPSSDLGLMCEANFSFLTLKI